MKRLLIGYIGFIFLFSFFSDHAKGAVVIDALTGQPLPKASIFDKSGKIIGVCSDDGKIPVLTYSDFPVTFSCLGYESVTLKSPVTDGDIELSPLYIELPEVNVDSKNSQVLYLQGYLREYSSQVTAADTVFLFREKNIDFMVPAKKHKKFNGWTLPRLLTSKSYYHFTDDKGLDSVSDYCAAHFSWSDWIGIISEIKIPSKIISLTHTGDTVFGKHGISTLWHRDDDNITLNIDVLSLDDYTKFVPGAGRLLQNGADFTLFNLKYDFTDVSGNTLYPDNIARISYNIQANGFNRNYDRLGNIKKTVYMDTYTEIYITDRKYISVSEAKKIEKNLKYDSDIYREGNVPELMASVQSLIDRVNSTDNEIERLHRQADQRLAGRTLEGKGYKYGFLPFVSKVIKKLGFQF